MFKKIFIAAVCLIGFTIFILNGNPSVASHNKLIINIGKETTLTSNSSKIVLGDLDISSNEKKKIELYYFPNLLNSANDNSRSVLGQIILRKNQSVKSEVMEESLNAEVSNFENGLKEISDNQFILVADKKVKGIIKLNLNQNGVISGDIYYHPISKNTYAPFYIYLTHFENEKLGEELFAKELVGIAHELSELIEVKFNK